MNIYNHVFYEYDLVIWRRCEIIISQFTGSQETAIVNCFLLTHQANPFMTVPTE